MISRRAFGLATIALAALLVALAWRTLPSVVDDAWISARYARSLALGHGLVYDAGQPPIEGYTNLGWTLLLAVAYLAGVPMHGAMVGLGLASGAIAVVCAGGLAASLAEGPRGRVPAAALLAPAGLALDPHLAVVTTNGLESAAFVALTLGLAWIALGRSDRSIARAAGAIAAAELVAMRPEGAAVAAILALADVARRRDAPFARRFAIAIGGAVALGAVEAARVAQYGALLPNTFAAKASRPLAERIAFDLDYLAPDLGFWKVALGIVLIAPALALLHRRSRDLGRAAIAIAATSALLIGVAFSVDLWMPGGRLLLAPLALSWCLFAGALAHVGQGAIEAPRPVRIAALAIALDLALLPSSPWARRVTAADVAHSAHPGSAAERTARWLGERLPDGSWLVTRDAGVLAYHAGAHVHVAEVHERALTQPHPGGRDLDPRDVVPARPEIVIVTVIDPHARAPFYDLDREVLDALPERYAFLGRVRQHHQRYYDVWARPDLTLDPLPDALRTGPRDAPY